ncbi:putative selenium-dependent hydroxylase accessory protein YqeC [bacterium DOLZORAL124_64_63]|nr:MAG: putative selenium-dependent hydroxylase accessory protein YqeC [bacterium DOLZORAL124_64_63]
MNFSFVDPWHLYLPREGGHVVGFAGSGGKTSLMGACARQLQGEGVPVLLTCTTRSEPVPGVRPCLWPEERGMPAGGLPLYLHAGVDEAGKWRGLPPEQVDQLGDIFADHVILVETDGSAKRPLKFYREWEPVWPDRTSLAVVVMGVGAVGMRAAEVVHRFDAAALPGLADLHPEKPWLWDHLLALLQAPDGYLAQVPPEVPAVLALGGLGAQDDSIGLFDFVGRAMADPRLPLVTFFESGGEAPHFRTACLNRPQEPA